MARNKFHGNRPVQNNRKQVQHTINDIYEQLALLVDKIAEDRHIETMAAFDLLNGIISGKMIESFDDLDC